MGTPLTTASFARAYVLPVLFLFVIPVFGFWFGGHAVGSYDDTVLENIATDPELIEHDRRELGAYFRANPLSAQCAAGIADDPSSPEWVDDACGDYAQFAWIEGMSAGAIGIGLLSLLVIALCVAVSLMGGTIQYLAFATGQLFLRVAAALQVLLQGVVAVLLSYWCTALWFETYVPKLILIVAIAVLAAVGALIVAIFKRIDGRHRVEGELIDEKRSPELWAHLRTLAKQLGTEPPDQIVAGVDDNFFVTENVVLLGDRELRGRTLFVSIALLRILEREEADAVLAHEMAHFSGGDTAFSARLSPLLHKHVTYIQALYDSVARPVANLMILYWTLFQLSLGKTSRERERRADKIASETTSAKTMATALLKTVAYSSYRTRVENELLQHDRAHSEELAIGQRVAAGFVAYVGGDELAKVLAAARAPHPFDSHPPLQERIAALGVEIDEREYGTTLGAKVESSWAEAIDGSAETELRLWRLYEDRFAKFHETELAYRFLPADDLERALVRKHFPDVTFAGKDGPSCTITYAGIGMSDWDAPLPFERIVEARVETRFLKKYLDLLTRDAETIAIPISKLETTEQELCAIYSKYLGRHRIAGQGGLAHMAPA